MHRAPLSRTSSLGRRPQSFQSGVPLRRWLAALRSLPSAVLLALAVAAAAALLLLVSMYALISYRSAIIGSCTSHGGLAAAVKSVHQDYGSLEGSVTRLQGQLRQINETAIRDAAHAGEMAQWSKADNGSSLSCFLFVGALTTKHNYDRRAAVRETWGAGRHPGVLVRFILYNEERDKALDHESAEQGDLVFVRDAEDSGYRSIVYKTYYFIEWVVAHVDALFILKTDDDSYVNLPLLVSELRSMCVSADCASEALYLGEEKRRGEVIVEQGHKWANLEYKEHLDLVEYFPYMYGGGYVFSADVARTLVQTQQAAGLKFMPNEDATFGFWVSGLNLRHVDHPRVKAAAGNCNLYTLDPKEHVGRFRDRMLRTEEDLCGEWLMCHKISSPGEMRYMHSRVLACEGDRALLDSARELASIRDGRRAGGRGGGGGARASKQNGGRGGSGAAGGRPRWQAHVNPLEVYMLTNYSEGSHLYGDLPSSPWSADGRRVIAHRLPPAQGGEIAPAKLRPPGEKQVLHIAVVSFTGPAGTRKHSAWRSRVVGSSSAWSWHHGAWAQWLGAGTSRQLLHIDRGCGAAALLGGAAAAREAPHRAQDLCSVVVDVDQGQAVKWLPAAVVSVHPDGTKGLAIDLCRLERGRPGHGVAGCKPPGLRSSNFDARDGVWSVDLRSGKTKLLVTYKQMADAAARTASAGVLWKTPKVDPFTSLRYPRDPRLPGDAQSSCLHWMGPPKFSACGTHFAFTYHVGRCGTGHGSGSSHGADGRAVRDTGPLASYLFTASAEGGRLWRVPIEVGLERTAFDFGPEAQLLVCDSSTGDLHLVTPRASVSTLPRPSPFRNVRPRGCRLHHGSAGFGQGDGGGGVGAGGRGGAFAVTDDVGHEWHKLVAWDLRRGDALLLNAQADDRNWWDASPGFEHLLPTEQPHFSPDGRYVLFQSGMYSGTGMQLWVVGVQNLQAGLASPLSSPIGTSSGGGGAGGHVGMGSVGMMQHQQGVAAAAAALAGLGGGGGVLGLGGLGAAQQGAPLSIKVFVDLAVRSGERLRWFCLSTPDIGDWEVHAFQTGGLTSRQAQELTDNLKLARVLARRVVLHFNAAGASDTVMTIEQEAWSPEEVTVEDVVLEVKGQHVDPEPSSRWYQKGQRRRHGGGSGGRGDGGDRPWWWPRPLPHWDGGRGGGGGDRPWWWPRPLPLLRGMVEGGVVGIAEDGSLVGMAAWTYKGEGGGGGGGGSGGGGAMVPVTNFGAWLKANCEQDDYVVLGMDLGAGREFALLEAMMADGSMGLVDRVHGRWHYSMSTFHRGLLFEDVFTLMGIEFHRWDD